MKDRKTTLFLFCSLYLPAFLLSLFISPICLGDIPLAKEFTNSLNMKLIRIEAGDFQMGQGDVAPKSRQEWEARDYDESPAHRVKISQPFFMGAHEVTNAQYEQFDPKRKEQRGKHGGSKGDDEPVTNVTWHHAAEFCAWLSKKEGKPYRLPTEAEWEYACRAGTTTLFSTGDELKPEQANYGALIEAWKESNVTPVGKYAANSWGLFDMYGNVEEWCHDWYGVYESDKDGKGVEQTDPVGRVDGIARVTRGGSLASRRHAEGKTSHTRFLRSANRAGYLPEDSTRFLGFRVVMGEMPKTKPLPVAEVALHQRDVKQVGGKTGARNAGARNAGALNSPPSQGGAGGGLDAQPANGADSQVRAGGESTRIVAAKEDVRPTLPQPLPKREGSETEPFFRNFAKDGGLATIPKETWGPVFSQWNHFTAIAVCPNGDVLATWYTTVSESGRELALGATRLRCGGGGASGDRKSPAVTSKWEPVSLFIDVPDMNDHAPVLLTHEGRMYHFFLQAIRGWDSASIAMRTSDDSGATWSKPRIILSRDDPQRLSQPCSAFVAKDGTIVLAVDGDNHKDERLMTSGDGGKTWQVRKGDLRAAADKKYVIHPAIAPLSDGSIICFLRGPHLMPAFVTKDFGDTWEAKATPFPGIGVGQKAAALRLKSGALLLLSIDSKNVFLKVGDGSASAGGTFAALSLDDGKTWPHVRKVEGVTGYMSVAQAGDGTIYAFGTRMSSVAFNEAWVRGK